MSTGLPTLAAAGRNERSSARVASPSDGSCEAVCLAGIGGKDSRAAGVREDRHSAASRHRLMRQQRRHVEQLLEPFGADDAGLPEEGIHDRVARGQRAGMGRGARAIRPSSVPT